MVVGRGSLAAMGKGSAGPRGPAVVAAVVAAVRARHGGAKGTEEEGVVLKAEAQRAVAEASASSASGEASSWEASARAGDALAALAAHWGTRGMWREAREGFQEALARYAAEEGAAEGAGVDGGRRGRAWEGLAACYLEEGASASALGALEEALAVPDLPAASRTYCLLQRGAARLGTGQLDAALEGFAEALELAPRSAAALCGAAACLARRAEAGRGARGADGELTRALGDARAAAGLARAAASLHPGLLAPWKLLGDAQTLVAALAPASAASRARRDPDAAGDVRAERARVTKAQREAEAEARHAYNVLRALPDSPYADGRALAWPAEEEAAAAAAGDESVGSGVPAHPDALQKLAEANVWNSLLHSLRFDQERMEVQEAQAQDRAGVDADAECEEGEEGGDAADASEWEPEFIEGIRESEAEGRGAAALEAARGTWTDGIGRENPHLGRARAAAEAAVFFGMRAASADPWDARRWLAEASAKAIVGDADGAACAASAALAALAAAPAPAGDDDDNDAAGDDKHTM